jgi:hypothetical protein
MMELQKNTKMKKLIMPYKKYTKIQQAADIQYGVNTTTTTTGTFANNNFTSPVPITTAYPVYTSDTTDTPSMLSTMAGTGRNLKGGGEVVMNLFYRGTFSTGKTRGKLYCYH